MMPALFRAWLIELRRDRVAFVLTFVLPIVFFSVFALMFGSAGSSAMRPIEIAVVDLDHSEASARLVAAIKKEPGLRVHAPPAPAADPESPAPPLDRAAALDLVARGELPVAVVIPKGFGASFGLFTEGAAPIELLADTADPIAPPMVAGMLQGLAMSAAPDLMMQRGLEMFEQAGGAMTPQQRLAVNTWLPLLRKQSAVPTADTPASATPAPGTPPSPAFSGPVAVKVVDVLGEKKSERGKVVSFSAAGIAVMFLLFMASGAAGTLLDEQESGVLERLLGSRLTMTRLLLGKWVFLTAVGVAQVTLMFIWGAIAFNLDLASHLPGFFVMTLATAAAGAALGLALATACRSRAQLSALSTIVILTMSAVGGSMVPRMFMPEAMQTVGLATFNAWAVDGYQKIFWFETGVASIMPQVAVLAGMSAVFLITARLLARRWETI